MGLFLGLDFFSFSFSFSRNNSTGSSQGEESKAERSFFLLLPPQQNHGFHGFSVSFFAFNMEKEHTCTYLCVVCFVGVL